jgi:hypothetical protein
MSSNYEVTNCYDHVAYNNASTHDEAVTWFIKEHAGKTNLALWYAPQEAECLLLSVTDNKGLVHNISYGTSRTSKSQVSASEISKPETKDEEIVTDFFTRIKEPGRLAVILCYLALHRVPRFSVSYQAGAYELSIADRKYADTVRKLVLYTREAGFGLPVEHVFKALSFNAPEQVFSCQQCGKDYKFGDSVNSVGYQRLRPLIPWGREAFAFSPGTFCSPECHGHYFSKHKSPPQITQEIPLGPWEECNLRSVLPTEPLMDGKRIPISDIRFGPHAIKKHRKELAAEGRSPTGRDTSASTPAEQEAQLSPAPPSPLRSLFPALQGKRLLEADFIDFSFEQIRASGVAMSCASDASQTQLTENHPDGPVSTLRDPRLEDLEMLLPADSTTEEGVAKYLHDRDSSESIRKTLTAPHEVMVAAATTFKCVETGRFQSAKPNVTEVRREVQAPPTISSSVDPHGILVVNSCYPLFDPEGEFVGWSTDIFGGCH